MVPSLVAFSENRLPMAQNNLTTAPARQRIISIDALRGMLVQGNLASAETEHMSLFCNTLQAIAEGYLISSIVLLCSLLLYWALLRFVTYQHQEAGLFQPRNNLTYYIDCHLQGHWQHGAWKKTRPLSSTCLQLPWYCGAVAGVYCFWHYFTYYLTASSICTGWPTRCKSLAAMHYWPTFWQRYMAPTGTTCGGVLPTRFFMA